MAEVFVSYSRSDEAFVERLVRAIEAHGISAWWDRSLEQNSNFGELIDQEIDNAGAVLVCWSDAAVKSRWVRGEAARAEHQGKYLGVLVGAVLPPTPFNTLNSANLVNWSGAADGFQFLSLLDSLATRLNRPDFKGAVDALRETHRRQEDAARAEAEAARVREAIEERRRLQEADAAARAGNAKVRKERLTLLRNGALATLALLAVAGAYWSSQNWDDWFPSVRLTSTGADSGLRIHAIASATADGLAYYGHCDSAKIAVSSAGDVFALLDTYPQRLNVWSARALGRSPRILEFADRVDSLVVDGDEVFVSSRGEHQSVRASPLATSPASGPGPAFSRSDSGRAIYARRECFFLCDAWYFVPETRSLSEVRLNFVQRAVISPDDGSIITYLTSPDLLIAHDGRTGVERARVEYARSVESLFPLPDSQRFLVWDRVERGGNGFSKLSLWSMNPLAETAQIAMASSVVRGGDRLFVAGPQSIDVMSLRDMSVLSQLSGPSRDRGTLKLGVSADGTLLAALSSDCRLRAWRLSGRS